MRVAIVNIARQNLQDAPALQALHQIARDRKHEIVAPESAELIIMTDFEPEDGFRSLREHPLVKERPNDCFAVNHWHDPYGFLPGLYTEVPRWTFSRRFSAGLYWPAHHQNAKISTDLPLPPNVRRYLFSFMGRNSHPVRSVLFSLPNPDGAAFIEDTHAYEHWNQKPGTKDCFQQRYMEVARDSYFALCPRGLRKPSIRLFEMMQLGVCPVVISDRYVFPNGPDWKSFCIIIKERNVPALWRTLQGREAEAVEKGKLARMAWRQWFSKEKQFNYVIDQLTAIKSIRCFPIAAPRTSQWRVRRRFVDIAMFIERFPKRLRFKLSHALKQLAPAVASRIESVKTGG